MTKEAEKGKGYCMGCQARRCVPDFSRYYECGNPQSDDYRHIVNEYHSCQQYEED